MRRTIAGKETRSRLSKQPRNLHHPVREAVVAQHLKPGDCGRRQVDTLHPGWIDERSRLHDAPVVQQVTDDAQLESRLQDLRRAA